MDITRDIRYIGVNDMQIDLFEGQYPVPHGIFYNSYAILDEQIAIMDTVDPAFTQVWLDNIANALEGRKPSYLVVHHMEPDHSGSIAAFAQAYPEAKLVSSAKAFAMMKNFFGTDYADRRVVVGEGDTLALGQHELTFLTAPMVHWPEVIVSYDKLDKVVFSADAFGTFNAAELDKSWPDEARRYYIGIVGKYGAQTQALLKKLEGLDVAMICSLHGPVLKENLGYYIDLYKTWSSYVPETDGVTIAYATIYGNTRKAAERLAEQLRAKGCPVALHDLARCDVFEAVADAFRYSKLVLACSTYNAEMFPPMKKFLHHITERNFNNRTVALIENGSWAPMATKRMQTMLESCKNLTYTDAAVKIMSALNDDSSAALDTLASELWPEA